LTAWNVSSSLWPEENYFQITLRGLTTAPKNDTTWRAAFKNMTREVNITASEELALMIKYTTGESKRFVQRLHNAYTEIQLLALETLGRSWENVLDQQQSLPKCT